MSPRILFKARDIQPPTGDGEGWVKEVVPLSAAGVISSSLFDGGLSRVVLWADGDCADDRPSTSSTYSWMISRCRFVRDLGCTISIDDYLYLRNSFTVGVV